MYTGVKDQDHGYSYSGKRSSNGRVKTGRNIVVSLNLGKPSNAEQSVGTGHTQESSMKEIDLLKKIERLERELVKKERMIREREKFLRELEIKQRDQTLNEKEKETSLLHKGREKRDTIVNDDFQDMFEKREDDLKERFAIWEREIDERLKRFIEQKQKMRLLDEKERTEREEQSRKIMRNMDQRERGTEERERYLSQIKSEREHEMFVCCSKI